MKTTVKSTLAFACILLLAIVSGCPIPTFTTLLAVDQTAQTTLFTDVSVENGEGNNGGGNAFRYDSSTGPTPATLTAGATSVGNVVQLPFLDGVVDDASIAAGLILYPLTNAADGFTAWTRGTPLAFTHQVVPDGTTDSIVILTFDLTAPAVSSQIEVFMDPASLTANGGAKRLNQDRDDIAGEAAEDDAIDYIAVNTAPVALTTGADRDPQASLSGHFAIPGSLTLAATTTTLGQTNSMGGTANITADSYLGSETWERYSAGTWTAVTVTPSYAAGTMTWTFPAALQWGEIYRLKYDRYAVAESAAVAGYIHRRMYNQNDRATRYATYVYAPVGHAFQGYNAIDSGGPDYAKYVDITFQGTRLVISTVTQTSVRIYDDASARFVQWASVIKLSDVQIRLLLPSTFNAVNPNQFSVYLSPTLTDDNGTAAATDDVFYGNTVNPEAQIVSTGNVWN